MRKCIQDAERSYPSIQGAFGNFCFGCMKNVFQTMYPIKKGSGIKIVFWMGFGFGVLFC